jgi:very-short-patch-repair endonuclease
MAGVQRGRISRRQLLAAGLSSSTIARLVTTGYLWPEHAGVYGVGHLAEIPGARETSALLAVRSGAALSHGSALRWWGMSRPCASGAGTIAVTVSGWAGGRPDGVIVHRSTILEPRDLRLHHGLPVTSPARTLLDVAAELPTRELERALDEGLVQRILRRNQVEELLRRSGRHRGRWPLEELILSHTQTTLTRSEAEERFLVLVRDAGLPGPLVNVHRHGFEIDFLWTGASLAVEIDGWAFHGTRAAFERDRRRDAALRTAGIEVIRITWRQLTEQPLVVAALAAAALASRDPPS